MITAEDTRLLDRLTIGGSPAAAAASAGVRRARTRGAGLEFHEYRHYQPGDDPRSIDWTIEARLQQLVVRVCRAEGDARLHVLVDKSASMSIGIPDKLACARTIAAALCYVALERRDAAAASTFSDRLHQHVPAASGRPHLFRVLAMLRATAAEGRSAMNRALTAYGAAVRGPGVVAVLSDFFADDDGFEGLQFLQHRGLTPAVVHVVAPEELDPDLADETELTDIENPAAAPIVVDASAVRAYRDRIDAHGDALRTFCLSHRFPYARVLSSDTFRSWVITLQRNGLFVASA